MLLPVLLDASEEDVETVSAVDADDESQSEPALTCRGRRCRRLRWRLWLVDGAAGE